MTIQAWALRRMISVYNSVTRRPHVPRERALRRILISQGFDIDLESPPRSGPAPALGTSANPPEDAELDGENEMEENSESESFTDDESLPEDLVETDVHVEDHGHECKGHYDYISTIFVNMYVKTF